MVVGTVVTLLGVAAWVASVPVVSYRRFGAAGAGEFSVALDRGMLWVTTSGTFFGPGLDVVGFGPGGPIERLTQMGWWPDRGYDAQSRSVWLPIWPVLVAGVGLAVGGWRAAKRRRGRVEVCEKCGYSRVGLGSDAACPECGASRTP